ncbi:hypothetical protein L9F63_007068, partial [Diploptera punctata]
ERNNRTFPLVLHSVFLKLVILSRELPAFCVPIKPPTFELIITQSMRNYEIRLLIHLSHVCKRPLLVDMFFVIVFLKSFRCVFPQLFTTLTYSVWQEALTLTCYFISVTYTYSSYFVSGFF